MALKYALWAGVAMALVAGLELLFKTPFGGILHYTPLHFAFDTAIAAVLLGTAASQNGAAAKTVSLAAGALFLLTFLAVMVAPASVSNIIGYPVGWFYLLIHLTLGCTGVIFPFLKSGKAGQRAT